MEFEYNGLKGKFIDFQVVETGFYFTWIKLLYEVYNEKGEVYDRDWTLGEYGTYGYEPEFDEDQYDEDGNLMMTDDEITMYVDDLFHDGYEIEDLVNGIRRSCYNNFGWNPINGVDDLIKDVLEVYFL